MIRSSHTWGIGAWHFVLVAVVLGVGDARDAMADKPAEAAPWLESAARELRGLRLETAETWQIEAACEIARLRGSPSDLTELEQLIGKAKNPNPVARATAAIILKNRSQALQIASDADILASKDPGNVALGTLAAKTWAVVGDGDRAVRSLGLSESFDVDQYLTVAEIAGGAGQFDCAEHLLSVVADRVFSRDVENADLNAIILAQLRIYGNVDASMVLLQRVKTPKLRLVVHKAIARWAIRRDNSALGLESIRSAVALIPELGSAYSTAECEALLRLSIESSQPELVAAVLQSSNDQVDLPIRAYATHVAENAQAADRLRAELEQHTTATADRVRRAELELWVAACFAARKDVDDARKWSDASAKSRGGKRRLSEAYVCFLRALGRSGNSQIAVEDARLNGDQAVLRTAARIAIKASCRRNEFEKAWQHAADLNKEDSAQCRARRFIICRASEKGRLDLAKELIDGVPESCDRLLLCLAVAQTLLKSWSHDEWSFD